MSLNTPKPMNGVHKVALYLIGVLTAAGIVGGISEAIGQGKLQTDVETLKEAAKEAKQTREDMVKLKTRFDGFATQYDKDQADAKEERQEILEEIRRR